MNAYADGGETSLATVFDGTYEALSEDDKVKYSALNESEKQKVISLSSEYLATRGALINFCNDMGANIIYLIKPDESKSYTEYLSIVNAPSTASGYSPWPVGYVQGTDKNYLESYAKMLAGELEGTTIVRDSNLKGGVPHTTSVIAVKNSQGRVVAVTCVQTKMSKLAEGRSTYMRFVIIDTVIAALLAIIAFTLIMRRQIINPLRKIVGEAERFAEQNSAPDTPLNEKISKLNEISVLATSLNDMENATLKYIANLSEAISERQKLDTELKIASVIQGNSIPVKFPAFPERCEFDIYASMTTAKQVGGDFYDFFLIDDDRLGLVIADVSGKGIAAALFMMVNEIILKDRALMGGSPAEIMTFVNDRICENNAAEMFITVWFGILEISTGKVTAVNAGHEDPVISAGGKDFEFYKAKHGLTVGAMEGVKYKEYEFKLGKGDTLFLYTDGIPEATDDKENMLTLGGLTEILNESKGLSPEKIVGNVLTGVNKFVGDAPQFDDMTMLCVKYFGKDDEKTLVVDATDENLDKVLAFVGDSIEQAGAGIKVVNQTAIAVEEIFVNVAHYAYGQDVGKAEIRVKITDGVARITFIDEGKPYNPLEKPDPDLTLSAMERQIGGLGIYMTKKLVDDISYEYVDGKNKLTLEKKL